MKPRLFTPGPTPVPEETLLELAKPVTYHRAAEAKAILAEVSEDLKYVFQTSQPVYTLTCSGTGGMEALPRLGYVRGPSRHRRRDGVRPDRAGCRRGRSAVRQGGDAGDAGEGARREPRHEGGV